MPASPHYPSVSSKAMNPRFGGSITSKMHHGHSGVFSRFTKSAIGFTLVELLTVIAVIGVLAAILIPVLSLVKRKGYEVDATSDLRALYTCTLLYTQDNRGRLFFTLDRSVSAGWGNLWVENLTPYLPLQGNANLSASRRIRNEAFHNKAVEAADRWIADYATNDNIMVVNDLERPKSYPMLTTIRHPTKEVLFVEGANNTATQNPRTSGAFTIWAKEMVLGNLDYPNTIARRHGSEGNPSFYAVFCDGHTEKININTFSADKPLRERMFSANVGGDSIYP